MLPTLESLVFCLRSSDALSVAADSLSFLNMRHEHFLSINFPIIVNFSFTIKCNFIQSKNGGRGQRHPQIHPFWNTKSSLCITIFVLSREALEEEEEQIARYLEQL